MALHTQINSNWVKYLNVRAKTVKLLGHTGAKMRDVAFVSDLLDLTPKTQATRNTDNLDFQKMKTLGASKDSIKGLKRQPTRWEERSSCTREGINAQNVYKLAQRSNRTIQ